MLQIKISFDHSLETVQSVTVKSVAVVSISITKDSSDASPVLTEIGMTTASPNTLGRNGTPEVKPISTSPISGFRLA